MAVLRRCKCGTDRPGGCEVHNVGTFRALRERLDVLVEAQEHVDIVGEASKVQNYLDALADAREALDA